MTAVLTRELTMVDACREFNDTRRLLALDDARLVIVQLARLHACRFTSWLSTDRVPLRYPTDTQNTRCEVIERSLRRLVTEISIVEFSAAVTRLHRGHSRHVQTVQVAPQPGDSAGWDGTVHVFAIDHPKAARAYAWSHVVDKKTQRRRCLAILGTSPINSPADAVRAAIASGEHR